MNHSGESTQGSDRTDIFGIARWRAWAPGVSTSEDWQAWIDGRLAPAPDAQPDVSYLPALLRRRLDFPGRMALHTAWPCADGLDSVQLVFASRHGALTRTMEMLTSLANNDMLSPTLFSLAVHNSTAGLFSIARADRGAATAMAAGLDTLTMSLLEGANMVAEGAPNVLVTYTDELAPAPYQGHVSESSSLPFAVSLLLTAASGDALPCRLGRHSGPAPDLSPEAALMQFLVGSSPDVVLGAGQSWRLERVHAD